MLRISELHDVRFDGKHFPYVPPEELSISRTLKLHRDWSQDVDPVTFEVIRHNLWHVNEEHGTTIQKVSGSPVAMYALDLNPSILTEDAEFVYFGPYMQYMSGVTDTQVKWILENRSDNPGIHDGDMFLANDPWVGAAHQQDVMLICPVFWEGELFCWITNCLHQYDVGGITPSSFCPAAESAFDEGILIPPVKIVENNVIRRDIEEVYLRASRKPEMVALDFRAQLAGNTTARARIVKLIERYGPAVVKGVMKRIIDNAEKAFLEKMDRLPDGQWQERTYVESCRPGDRRTHRVMLTVRKEGTRLTFENHGSAPQDGAMNATYSGWRGSVMVAINELLCWDQYFAVGGALRHIDFNPTPGTFNCANFPGSVSTAPIQAMEISLYPAYNAISKMIHTDPEMRGDILCIGGTSQWPCTVFRGIDQWGERYGYILIDPIGGAIGAFAHADGINTGGQVRTPICQLPNVEHTEQSFPVLFLYRKELPDSGGAGPLPRRDVGRELLHPPQHAGDRAGHAVLRECRADLPRHDGRLSVDHQPLHLRHRQRHLGALRARRDAGGRRRGRRHAGAPGAPPAEPDPARVRRVRGALVRRRRFRGSDGTGSGGNPDRSRKLSPSPRRQRATSMPRCSTRRPAASIPTPPPDTARACARSGYAGSIVQRRRVTVGCSTKSPRICTRSATTRARSGPAQGAAPIWDRSKTTTSSAAIGRIATFPPPTLSSASPATSSTTMSSSGSSRAPDAEYSSRTRSRSRATRCWTTSP